MASAFSAKPSRNRGTSPVDYWVSRESAGMIRRKGRFILVFPFVCQAVYSIYSLTTSMARCIYCSAFRWPHENKHKRLEWNKEDRGENYCCRLSCILRVWSIYIQLLRTAIAIINVVFLSSAGDPKIYIYIYNKIY